MQASRWVWLLASVAAASGEIPLSTWRHFDLIHHTGEMLCSYRLKLLYVYFESDRLQMHTEALLRNFSDCGISYISLRKENQSSPLQHIKDDGILMYLLMIIADSREQIALSLVLKKSAAKHLSHIFLLVEDARQINFAWLQHTFRAFWGLWCLNVVVVFWFEQELHILRYQPLGLRDDLQISRVPHAAARPPPLHELFPRHLPNMHGKSLRMCIYQDEIRAIFQPNNQIIGSDGLMSAYIAERLNATRIVHRPARDDRHNRSTDICFDEVAEEVDDMSLNIRLLAPDTFGRRAEYTFVYRRDDLCILVPKARIATTFWNLLRAFKPFVWLGMVATLTLSYAFCRRIGGGRLQRSEALPLQLIAGLLGMPLDGLERGNSALRCFLLAWLCYGILISNAFKANLMSNLVFCNYEPDIDSIEALVASPYPVLLFARHMKHAQHFLANNELGPQLRAKFVVVPEDSVMQQAIDANNLENAYLEKYHVAAFQANARRHYRYGRPLYHLMATCLVPFHAVYIVPYGSPYLGYVNFLMRSAQEYGFSVHWERLMQAAFLKSGKSVLRGHKQGDGADDFEVLSVKHFHAAFSLLRLGWLLAALALLAERVALRLRR